jgi:hypothetical protein
MAQQQPSTDQNLNERKPQSVNGDGTRHEENDAQRNAARRVKNGVEKEALPIAERYAGSNCDSSLEDER